MQLGIISDIHGNWSALQTALAALSRDGVDRIICLGDVVDPFPSSRRVFEFLCAQEIPILRGNHEDYIVSACENPEHEIHRNVRLRPISLASGSFDALTAARLKSLPLSMTVRHEGKTREQDLFLFHASPSSNSKGWRFGIDTDLERELLARNERHLVCGHWHDPKTESWQGRTLVTCGSVGLPLLGKLATQFLIAESAADGWKFHHREETYSPDENVDEYVRSGWFHRGGPIAWLLMIELSQANRKLSYLFPWLAERQLQPATEEEWTRATREFLDDVGGWSIVEPLLNRHTS